MAKENQYNPNVKYGWNKETKFELDGNEFGLILNTFRTVLASEEAQRILLLNNANDKIESVLQRNVESGNVQPAEIPETESPSVKEEPTMKAVKEDQ